MKYQNCKYRSINKLRIKKIVLVLQLSAKIIIYSSFCRSKIWKKACVHWHMNTHSRDHMITTTTNTTAAMMTAMCGIFNRRANSFLSPLGFRLVCLYFMQSFCRVWSTVATSTDTSAIYSQGGKGRSYSNAKCHQCSSKSYLPFQYVLVLTGMWLMMLK